MEVMKAREVAMREVATREVVTKEVVAREVAVREKVAEVMGRVEVVRARVVVVTVVGVVTEVVTVAGKTVVVGEVAVRAAAVAVACTENRTRSFRNTLDRRGNRASRLCRAQHTGRTRASRTRALATASALAPESALAFLGCTERRKMKTGHTWYRLGSRASRRCPRRRTGRT